MKVIQKTIGRLPVNLGDYDSTRAYGKKNRVTLYDCEWESKVDNNTHAPATIIGGVVTPDANWKLISGVPANYGLDTKVANLQTALSTESERAQAAENAESTRAQAAENALQNAIGALTQSNIEVVADHTQVQDPDATTIYREYGESSYADWMYQNGSWQKMAEYDNAVDDTPTAGSDNLVKSGGVVEMYGGYEENHEFIFVKTDAEGHILYAIKNDGDFYFGAGVPQQVKKVLDTKVNAEDGKGLINAIFASAQDSLANQEWLQVITDKDGRIIEGTKRDKKVINLPLECPTIDEIRSSIPKSKWYGKTAVTLGDSHSQRRDEWMPKLCEMLGMEYLDSLNSQIPVGNVTPPAYEMYINAMTAQVAALISLKSVAIPDVIFIENVHYFYNDRPSAFPFKPSSMELVGEYNMTKDEEIAYFNEHFSEIVNSAQNKEPRKVIKTVVNGKTCTVTFSASSISSGTFVITLDGATISTELTEGMTLAQAVSKIMEWQFGEYTDWVNVSKTDNSITFRYNGEGQAAFNFSYNAGGTGLSASAGSITDIGESIYRYYASNTMDDWNTASKWIRVVDWYQGYMQNKGVMELLQENFPESIIVVLGLANWRLTQSDYNDLDYYEFTHTDSFLLSESRKDGFLECGKMYDCKTVDVEKCCGISPINYLTFYNPDEVHPKPIGYERWAETIAKELG